MRQVSILLTSVWDYHYYHEKGLDNNERRGFALPSVTVTLFYSFRNVITMIVKD